MENAVNYMHIFRKCRAKLCLIVQEFEHLYPKISEFWDSEYSYLYMYLGNSWNKI